MTIRGRELCDRLVVKSISKNNESYTSRFTVQKHLSNLRRSQTVLLVWRQPHKHKKNQRNEYSCCRALITWSSCLSPLSSKVVVPFYFNPDIWLSGLPSRLSARVVTNRLLSLVMWDDIIIRELLQKCRIAVKWITDSYLLSGAHQPECTTCQCMHSLSSTSLLNVLVLTILATKYFVATSMKELFETINVCDILNFIK